jgi:hypothetical protein
MKAVDEDLVSSESLSRVFVGREDLEPYKFYMEERWIRMVMWWHTRSVKARRKYFALRAVVIVGGAMIPVLTTVDIAAGWRSGVAVGTTFVGAVVAAAAAWEGIANYGDIWREKRRAAELLKVEGYEFTQLCGKYDRFRNESDKRTMYDLAFRHFAAEVEAIIAREVGEYLVGFDRSMERTPGGSDATGDRPMTASEASPPGRPSK